LPAVLPHKSPQEKTQNRLKVLSVVQATIAESVALWLEEKGITHAFGIIGGGNHVLWDAIAERGFTEIVCVHHEQAATMAATYYYRTSGKVALALVTTGAGSTNALTGVMAAYMDGIPVLVISGNEGSKYMGKGTRVWGVQGYGSSELVRDMTKDSCRATLESALQYLEHLYKLALRPPMGPVWLDIPKDVQGAAL
jgi:acetolactate synthase I/II/III large subunit